MADTQKMYLIVTEEEPTMQNHYLFSTEDEARKFAQEEAEQISGIIDLKTFEFDRERNFWMTTTKERLFDEDC